MKLKKYNIFFFFLIISSSVLPLADWTIFLEVQAKNDLDSFAKENLRDLSKIGSNEKVTVVLQWHQLGKPGVWRYKINKDSIELISHDISNGQNDCVKSVVDGASWAFKTYPSKHKAFVMWGHASGIGDPSMWWDHNFSRGRDAIDSSGVVSDDPHRGILFDYEHKSYMNNQQLATALRQIKKDVLGGEKLDVLGMDACMMAMVEVAYQARDTAHYLVTSQEVSPGKGWRYASLLAHITGRTFSPADFSKHVVSSFEHFYKGKIAWYTQSAIDLTNIESLKQNIDCVVADIFTCKQAGNAVVRDAVRRARNSSLEFYSKSYIDLYSFYVELEKEFAKSQCQNLNGCSQLKMDLQFGKKLIESLVIANAAGSNFTRAKGVSIYYPQRIDTSYPKTEFAQNSAWLSFLRESL